MARRYRGVHSPGAQQNATDAGPPHAPAPVRNRFRGARVARSTFRERLLFILPLPLLFSGLGELRAGDARGMATEFGALALLLLSAWLVREGVEAQEAFDARKVARPPAIPRKLFGAVASGLGIGLAAWGGMGQPIAAALLTGLIGGASLLFAFGLDPMRAKGMEGMSDFDAERVARAVERAEKLLKEITEAAHRFGDPALERRVADLARAAREMFRAVEEDPRDLSAARKYLSVYLIGARDATVKFADLYARTRDAEARADYESLLDDLEASFNARKAAMIEDNRSDLDVEIEVLRDRLRQTGLRATRQETL